MEKVILIFAYYSFKDPIFQSAVLPYFLNFPDKGRFRFILLTFEHPKFPLTSKEIIQITELLDKNNITWTRGKWRSGIFKPIKKVQDFASATLLALRLIRKFKVQAIYSEGFPGAILTHYISLFSKCKHMVHSFEPHADYMVEAGVWTKNSWETKLLQWHELKIAKHATYIFTATSLFIERLRTAGVRKEALYRVPSCVDLNHFKFNESARNTIRNRYGIKDNEQVLVYLGKFGGMYMDEEAFIFFKLCQTMLGAWVMILSQESPQKIQRLAASSSLQTDRLIVESLTRSDVPGYLSAADMGFVGVRQWPSKMYCSPIKTGEYLACGLPVIVPSGISDDAELIASKGLGLLMKKVNHYHFTDVINAWSEFLKNMERKAIRENARTYIDSDRSISRYQLLYQQLFSLI